MTEPEAPAPKPRPRWGALIGLAMGPFVVLPLVCLALYLLARLGVGDPTQPWVRVARIALVFAGLPAAMTGAGVGRLCVNRAHDAPIGQVGPRALKAGVPAMTAGGAALAVLVAVPLGGLPLTAWAWLWVPLAGAFAGAIGGTALALAVWQRLLYSIR